MSDRRYVLKVVAGCAGAVLTGAAVVPAVALVSEPGQQAGGGADPWVRVARIDALEPNVPTKANVVGSAIDAWLHESQRVLGAVWLIKDSATSVRAYSTVCPHLGCAIELAGGHFNCPCHDSAFDLHGGRITGPSPRGMDPMDVQVGPEWVAVRFRRFRQGVPERAAV